MEKDDKGSTMIRMGVSGWMFLLVPAYPGCPGSKAVKRSLLLLLFMFLVWRKFFFICLECCWIYLYKSQTHGPELSPFFSSCVSKTRHCMRTSMFWITDAAYFFVSTVLSLLKMHFCHLFATHHSCSDRFCHRFDFLNLNLYLRNTFSFWFRAHDP